jgi:hypothetical protein
MADHVDNERQRMGHPTASIDRDRAISGDLWRLPETAPRSQTDKRAHKPRLLDLLVEDSQLISNDVGGVKTHLLRSGRRSRLS